MTQLPRYPLLAAQRKMRRTKYGTGILWELEPKGAMRFNIKRIIDNITFSNFVNTWDPQACSSCSSHVKPTKSSRRSDDISHKSHNSTRNDKIQAVIASYKTRPKTPKPSTPEDSAPHAARWRPRRNVETRGSGTSKPSSPHIRPDLRHLNPRRLKTRRFLRPAGGPGPLRKKPEPPSVRS